MIGEKAGRGEMKEQLAGYVARRDVDGAKAYFLSAEKERPDVLMEASDVTGRTPALHAGDRSSGEWSRHVDGTNLF